MNNTQQDQDFFVGTIYEDKWGEFEDGDNSEEEMDSVNYTGNHEEVEEFSIDSGATCHATYKDNDLDNRAPSKSIVYMGDETKAEIEATGDLSLRVCIAYVVVSLSPIHYVPRFKKHIISVSRLCRDGYEITSQIRSAGSRLWKEATLSSRSPKMECFTWMC